GRSEGPTSVSEPAVAPAPADTVWTAIALHTTPGIPGRMGPEIAAIHWGVMTDVVGLGLVDLNADEVDQILAVHPRGDFKTQFLQAYFDGFKNRPDTT